MDIQGDNLSESCIVPGCIYRQFRMVSGLCYGHEKNLIEFPKDFPDPRKKTRKRETASV